MSESDTNSLSSYVLDSMLDCAFYSLDVCFDLHIISICLDFCCLL